MDWATVIESISQLGFPIFCVLACAFYINSQSKIQMEDMNRYLEQQRTDSIERETKYQEQIEHFGDTLQKFNETLNRIDTRLAVVEDAVKK